MRRQLRQTRVVMHLQYIYSSLFFLYLGPATVGFNRPLVLNGRFFSFLFWCKASIYGSRMFSHTNLHFGEIIIFRSWDLSVQCYSLVSFTSVYTPPRGIHIDGLSMFGTRIRRSCQVNVPNSYVLQWKYWLILYLSFDIF